MIDKAAEARLRRSDTYARFVGRALIRSWTAVHIVLNASTPAIVSRASRLLVGRNDFSGTKFRMPGRRSSPRGPLRMLGRLQGLIVTTCCWRSGWFERGVSASCGHRCIVWRLGARGQRGALYGQNSTNDCVCAAAWGHGMSTATVALKRQSSFTFLCSEPCGIWLDRAWRRVAS